MNDLLPKADSFNTEDFYIQVPDPNSWLAVLFKFVKSDNLYNYFLCVESDNHNWKEGKVYEIYKQTPMYKIEFED